MKPIATEINKLRPEDLMERFFYLQLLLKSKCIGTHFVNKSNPFASKEGETFQDLLETDSKNKISSIDFPSLFLKQAKMLTIPNSLSESKEIPKVTSVDDFITSIWPIAKQAASLIGLDPKILVAQAILETGWGKCITKDADGISTNNLFNIKADTSNKYESVRVQTTEYLANKPIKTNAAFKKYPSIEHSLNDYISLIRGNRRYQKAITNAGNSELFVNELHKAGYATDPEYSSKILSIYHGKELKKVMDRCGLPV